MSDAIAITHDRHGSEGRYTLTVEGQESELMYSLDGARMIVTHTYVPRRQRGRRYGRVLVRRAMADAEAQGLQIVPVCSFARAEMQRLGKEIEK